MVYRRKDYEYTIGELIKIARDAISFSSPQFQLYTGDFLSSPRVLLMPWGAPQAFFFLLLFEWESADCSLPNDEDALKIFSRANDHWPEVRKSVLEMFTEVDGKLYNRRLLIERKKQITRSDICKKAGKASGKARKNNPRRKMNRRLTQEQLINDNDNDNDNANALKEKGFKTKDIKNNGDSSLDVLSCENVSKPDHVKLFDSWNNTDGLAKHIELTAPMILVAKEALKEHSLLDLKKTIRNYALVLLSPLTRYIFKHTFPHFFNTKESATPPYKVFFSECEPHRFFLKNDTDQSLDRDFMRCELRDHLASIQALNPILNLETMLGRVNGHFANSWESWRYIVDTLSVRQLKDIQEHLNTYTGDKNG